uniref:Uncharacterized protein n=1 Tax=viral metagenome TaxID=1070528 RepID=A0A6C0F6U8_9ZZZZ|tara:strand:- start:1115 stop:1687 length:573 start_codon:yes stop_codon:yes gene_type:complete
MSYVLYYSKYCENCKKILYKVGKDKIKEDIHFLCIDKRKVIKDKIYITLSDGKELLMPNEIKEVPALLLLNRGNRIIYGDEILKLFNPILKNTKENKINGGEPLAFSNYEMGATLSDNYSYLDQNSDDLSTKGEGGLRQMHSFATYNLKDEIETPPETFISEKIKSGNVSKLLTKLQEERNKEMHNKTMI